MDWPLLLAGPIVRRVDPRTAAVWLALSEPGIVRLDIWSGPRNAPPTSDTPPPDALASAAFETVAVGARLHLALPTIAIDPTTAPLEPGGVFAYNISIAPVGKPRADLRSLGLLDDSDGMREGQRVAWPIKALGYASGRLPSFMLPPVDITALRLLHGSCRRPHADVPDMLAALDELVADPLRRPHQLFLAGDQIYADDVASSLLHIIIPAATDLLSGPGGAIERLPILWPRGFPVAGDTGLPPDSTTPVPNPVQPLPPPDQVTSHEATRDNFPAGMRRATVIEDARLTTTDGPSHLLSFGEFCAMHLFAWSNGVWPLELPTIEEIYAIPEDALPEIWKLHVGIASNRTTGLKQQLEKKHPELGELNTFMLQSVEQVLEQVIKDQREGYEDERELIVQFRDSLDRVRRVLANVATYMMWDDHEVTDDWNLSGIWCDRVYTSPLGRAVLRNGLLASVLFQAWGNEPGRFAAPSGDQAARPHRELLDLAGSFMRGTAPPEVAVTDRLDLLFGHSGERFPLVDESDEPSLLAWHFTVDGPQYRVLVLDVRNRRGFPDRLAPPENIAADELKDQVSEGPRPTGIEALIVVSPLTVFGPPVFDELFAGLFHRLFDARDFDKNRGLLGTNPDAVEGWTFAPAVFEALLKRLATFGRVVILSGDVHYGTGVEATYWRKGAQQARIAQFTSSGFKNLWPYHLPTLLTSFSISQRLQNLISPSELLGWDKREPSPLRTDGASLSPGRRDLLRREPLRLPVHGWPAGVGVDPQRPPDWAWSYRLLGDPRAGADLPSGARPVELRDNGDTTDVALDLPGYRLVLNRHARQRRRIPFTRHMLFYSNFGLVRFERTDQGLVAIQELHAAPLPGDRPEVFTLHRVELDADQEMPTIGGGG